MGRLNLEQESYSTRLAPLLPAAKPIPTYGILFFSPTARTATPGPEKPPPVPVHKLYRSGRLTYPPLPKPPAERRQSSGPS